MYSTLILDYYFFLAKLLWLPVVTAAWLSILQCYSNFYGFFYNFIFLLHLLEWKEVKLKSNKLK